MESPTELRDLDYVDQLRTILTPAARFGRRGVARLLLTLCAVALIVTGCGEQEHFSGTAPDSTASAPASVVPSSTPPTAGMIKSAPTEIAIPSIGVDSTLMRLGLDSEGEMQVPAGGFPAGWYTGAPTPGETGPAVIAGHVDWGGEPGVFFDLRKVEAGATISVTRGDGTIADFEVTEVTAFPKAKFPTDLVYGTLDYAGLRLITCGGAFDEDADSYDDNIVAFAKLVGSRAQ